MEEIIAQKYTNALIKGYKTDALKEIYDSLKEVYNVFGLVEFKDIINSPCIDKNKKKDLVFSLITKKDSVKNLIEVLTQNDRIDIIPFIVHSLNKHFMTLDKKYEAILYTSKELSSNEVENIASNLAKKLGVALTISQSICDIEGIKLVVTDLGIEISFLQERFFDDLKSHVLQAI